jgi:hypothetical protein
MSMKKRLQHLEPKLREQIVRMLRDCAKEKFASKVDYLSERARLKAAIEQRSEKNQVAVVFNGRDCDCVEYEGVVYKVPATVTHVEHCIDQYGQWADGPFGWEIKKPSSKVKRQSRDLAMEAFEDGHAHVVYTATQHQPQFQI